MSDNLKLPLVSYLVPSYNHSVYVIETLNSILKEPYPNKELIILDDGSTDNSCQIIKNWVKKNKNKINILFNSEIHRGFIPTLNRLVLLSKGDFVRIIASDDILYNGSTIQFIYKFSKNPKILGIFGDCFGIDMDSKVIYNSTLTDLRKVNIMNYRNSELIANEIISHWAVAGPSLMIKKKAFKEFGMYDESLLIEDWDFYLKLVSAKKLLFIDAKVAFYRFHPHNFSRIKNRKIRVIKLTSMLKSAEKNLSRFGLSLKNKLKVSILKIKFKIAFLERKPHQMFIIFFKIIWLLFLGKNEFAHRK